MGTGVSWGGWGQAAARRVPAVRARACYVAPPWAPLGFSICLKSDFPGAAHPSGAWCYYGTVAKPSGSRIKPPTFKSWFFYLLAV